MICHVTKEEVVEHYLQSRSMRITAAALGVSKIYVNKTVHAAGVDIPPRGRNQRSKPEPEPEPEHPVRHIGFPSGITGSNRGVLQVEDGKAFEVFPAGRFFLGEIFMTPEGFYTCGNGRVYSNPLPAAFDLAVKVRV